MARILLDLSTGSVVGSAGLVPAASIDQLKPAQHPSIATKPVSHLHLFNNFIFILLAIFSAQKKNNSKNQSLISAEINTKFIM